MDYNTQRERLTMAEYGRYVQEMVEYCKEIEDDDERQQCAESIVGIMAEKTERNGKEEEFVAKLWNHLAAIANYELDIHYPVEIKREEDLSKDRQRVEYPQRKIERRHYGAIVEDFTKAIEQEEDEQRRTALAWQVGNQMKRDLSNWNLDAMSDEKVRDDMEQYTHGKVQLDTRQMGLISDGDLLSSRNPTTVKKKRKR